MPSDQEEPLESSEFVEAVITEITDNISELDSSLDSKTEPLQSLEQPEVLDLTDPMELFNSKLQIPALRQPAAVPNVKWQQNNTTILLVIEAPDVVDYYLNVTACSLQYR